jgi:Glycosyl hydrolase family 26
LISGSIRARGRAARWGVVLLAALCAGALAAPPAPASGAVEQRAAVVGASQVGARAAPVKGQSPREAVESLEKSLGAKIPVVSQYPAWNATFPTSFDRWLRDSGHDVLLMLKLKRKDGSRPKWRDLANAQRGDALYADMVRWADSFKEFGAPLYVAFHKEPNEPANKKNGTPADYQAAWARLVTFMAEQGVTNVQWVFAMSGRAYAKSVNTWYPGDRYVDIIASTGVNSCSGSSCTYRQQAQIMAPMVSWAQGHPDKRIAVCEGGTVESTVDPQAKAKWLTKAQTDLKASAYQRLEFVIYWSSGNYRLNTSNASLNAAGKWFADPYWS